jgi:hypothetical protein
VPETAEDGEDSAVDKSGLRAGARGDDPLAEQDPAAVPVVSWRTEIVGGTGMSLLAGVTLMLAPAVLGYRSGDPVLHDVLLGAVIAVVAVVRLVITPWRSALSWINFVLGAWVFVAAFWLSESMTARWTEATVGALVVFMTAISEAAAASAERRAGRTG